MKKTSKDYDVIVIGGGPTGLAFATSLAKEGIKVCILEKESRATLAKPPADGRDIALTHNSLKILGELGILKRLGKGDISPIREARVLDGSSSGYFLNFTRDGKGALGNIVGNHLIRKAAYGAAKSHSNVTIETGAEVKSIKTDDVECSVALVDGRIFTAPLAVAADGRFSASRRRMGMGASMNDFGRTVIVCRMKHKKPHNGIAHECFQYDRTLAVLPLKGNMSSVVITLPSSDADAVLKMPVSEFNRDVAARFDNRLGAMSQVGERHAYPLVAIYADKFTAARFALLGDAAVGMHPVTAHGYNFGLKGQALLSSRIIAARDAGLDIGSAAVLKEYSRRHRAATLPLYLATNALVSLYTDTRPRAKWMRRIALHLGNGLPPFKQFVTNYLSDAAEG
jgi:ubiquinone biosynthesis UbiH/UbiF/VisC/COQ6 family hydroxylase